MQSYAIIFLTKSKKTRRRIDFQDKKNLKNSFQSIRKICMIAFNAFEKTCMIAFKAFEKLV